MLKEAEKSAKKSGFSSNNWGFRIEELKELDLLIARLHSDDSGKVNLLEFLKRHERQEEPASRIKTVASTLLGNLAFNNYYPPKLAEFLYARNDLVLLPMVTKVANTAKTDQELANFFKILTKDRLLADGSIAPLIAPSDFSEKFAEVFKTNIGRDGRFASVVLEIFATLEKQGQLTSMRIVNAVLEKTTKLDELTEIKSNLSLIRGKKNLKVDEIFDWISRPGAVLKNISNALNNMQLKKQGTQTPPIFAKMGFFGGQVLVSDMGSEKISLKGPEGLEKDLKSSGVISGGYQPPTRSMRR